MAFNKKSLTKKSENLSDWYNQVVLQAELADYGPAKGTMIFRPYGYGLWESVQRYMDAKIKDRGVENAYFPLFIPMSLLEKEKDHVEGFSPELAVVTIGGGEKLEEPLVVRPTSETIMYDTYAKWVQSWRDLPLLINQWNNVVRWEKRTYLFLRTSEFLWQEGHTAHATHEEAQQTVTWAMGMYAQTYRDVLALPGIVGRKSEAEKFAGAVSTLTYESLMPEGKALQACTSHDLGQNFAKPFNISFQDQQGQNQYAWQTSWGFSTRSLGGMIMAHGDDQGLRLPPKMAPVQVVVLPVRYEDAVVDYCQSVVEQLRQAGMRAKLDTRDDESLGFRINKWELKGVPVRLEVGGREVESNTVTAVRRDSGHKESVSVTNLSQRLETLLEEIQANLFTQAHQFLADNTHKVDTYDQFKQLMAGPKGFLLALWCENPDCENKIKAETKASTRCLPLDAKEESGHCIYCNQPATHRWVFAHAS
jgi:prolyl-tRNA synthetase